VGKFYETYKRNIYGVIGTLMFHILLVSAFLIAELDRKGNPQEEAFLIELPELLQEEEKVEEKQELQESEPVSSEASAALNQTQNNRTNIASNRLAQNEKFFNEEYQRELQDAQRLVSDVNSQLAKEKVNWEDIKMPEQSTEGMHRDSISNTIYTGESNLVYYLENRYHRRLPIPVYLTQGGGKVIVDITVNRQGTVIQAEPRKTPGIRDEQLYLYAKAAASRTIFNAEPSAPEPQRGTIHYTFVAQ
jgi:DNA gyrase/topoisomerase IV subunit A